MKQTQKPKNPKFKRERERDTGEGFWEGLSEMGLRRTVVSSVIRWTALFLRDRCLAIFLALIEDTNYQQQRGKDHQWRQ